MDVELVAHVEGHPLRQRLHDVRPDKREAPLQDRQPDDQQGGADEKRGIPRHDPVVDSARQHQRDTQLDAERGKEGNIEDDDPPPVRPHIAKNS